MHMAINCHKLIVNSPPPNFLSGVENNGVFYNQCFLD